MEDSGQPSPVESGYTSSIAPADTIHGQRVEDVPFAPEVYQFYPDTCAIQSQHLVLQQFGIDVTQNELIKVATENGWYAQGHGTPMEFAGKLLEHYGVPANATNGNNIFNLANELAQGHQVIVGVDSGELVFPELEMGEDNTADHALVVVGIDTSDPNNVQVVVTDPGTGNRQWAYSEEQFMDAWKDSNCFMVSTDEAPQTATGGEYPILDSFAGIPSDTLSQMASVDFSANYDFIDEVLHSVETNPEAWAHVMEDYPNIFYTDECGELHFVEPSTGEDITLGDGSEGIG